MQVSVQYGGRLVGANMPSVLSMDGLAAKLGKNGAGFQIFGLKDIVTEIVLADPQYHRQEINTTIFNGLSFVRNAAKEGIERAIPYRHYPVSSLSSKKTYLKDYHKHGYLRDKKYGPLKDDVKRAVSADASGGTVSIYSLAKKSDGTRWPVLNWLNSGTLPRKTGGRTRIKKNGTVVFDRRVTSSKNGVTFGRHGNLSYAASNNRGSIEAQNFFLPSAQSGVAQAETYITNEIIKILTPK